LAFFRVVGVVFHRGSDFFHRRRRLFQARGLLFGPAGEVGGRAGDFLRGAGHLLSDNGDCTDSFVELAHGAVEIVFQLLVLLGDVRKVARQVALGEQRQVLAQRFDDEGLLLGGLCVGFLGGFARLFRRIDIG
jgi:hypothetical protein